MQRSRLLSFGLSIAMAAMALAGCGGGQETKDASNSATPSAPAGQTAPPATKTSGKVVLYTSESADQVNEMKADFEKLYPGVTVEVFRSGTGPVIAKLQAEMQGGDVQADLIWFADIAFFNGLIAKDKLVGYESPSAKDLPANFKYSGGKAYEVRQIFNVVAYNTKTVKDAPKSWKDLANAAYKGKIGMASPLYSGAAFSTMGTLVNMKEFGWKYYEDLKGLDVKVEQGNGGVANKLASGEYAMVSVVDFMVRNAKNQGSPVEHIWPAEGAILIPTPVGILKDGKNPEAAKLFVDYLLSEAGQKLFLKQGYIPVKAGIGMPPGAPPIEQLKIAPTDEAYIATNRDKLKEGYQKLFPQ